jgi:hypothetical protein
VSTGTQARFRDGKGRIGRATTAWLFLLSWAVLGCFVHTIDQRSWVLLHAWVEAIGERGEFHVDGVTLPEFAGLEDDTHVARDHRYARNAPGTSLFGAGVYRVVSSATGISYRESFELASCLVSWLVTGLATAVAMTLMAHVGAALVGSALGGVVIALAYGLGTLAFPWSGLPYQHQTAAVWIIAALYLGGRLREGGGTAVAVGAGLCLGLVPFFSYAQVPVAGCIGLYVLYACRTHRERLLVAGAAVAGILPTLALNAAYWGGPFTTVYQASGDPEVVDLTPSWSLALARLHFYLINPASSLFFYSPVLALGAVGLFRLPSRHRALQVTALLGIFVTLGHLLIVGGRGAAQWGPRLMIPLTPLLILGLAWWWGSRGRRITLVVVTVVSILCGAAGALGPVIYMKTGKKNGVVAYAPLLVGRGDWRKLMYRHQRATLSTTGEPELRFPLRPVLGWLALVGGIGLAHSLARSRRRTIPEDVIA